MGSSTSRARNKDIVRQCQDRRNLMSTTIRSLHHLASAHDFYLRALLHMATSLKMFASGESLAVSEHTQPIFVQYPVSPSAHKPVGSENKKEDICVEQKKVLHQNLLEIAAAIAECFVKASDAGETVLELLENGQKEKKVVHLFNSLFKVLSSRSRSRKQQVMRWNRKIAGIQGSVEQRNHASTLEKILAWEKKLYNDIKIRETIKIKLDKKLSSLQHLKDKGNRDSSVAKTRASINKLQSLLTVAREAASTTASAIIQARDSQLTQQILELFQGYFKMWQMMNHFHSAQCQISQQIGSLVSSSSGEETSDLHHAATRELGTALSNWQTTFSHLIKCQRNYNDRIRSWLNQTRYEISKDTSHAAVKLVKMCNEWKQVVDRAPDKAVSEGIKHFRSSIWDIYANQAKEMIIKGRVSKYKYRLERRSKSLERREKRYYKLYKYADAPMKRDLRDYRDSEDYERQVLDEERDRQILMKKKVLIVDWSKRVEREKKRYLKAVEVTRLTTLNEVKASLPGAFKAMAEFSGLLVRNLEGVYRNAESMH